MALSPDTDFCVPCPWPDRVSIDFGCGILRAHTGTEGASVMLASFDAAGKVRWAQATENPGLNLLHYPQLGGLAVSGAGVVIGGAFRDIFTLAGDTLRPAGDEDGFFATLAP